MYCLYRRNRAALAVLSGLISIASAQAKPVVSPIAAPAGTHDLHVEWKQLVAPDLGALLIAIARPAGKGPFPSVAIFHGSHGFAREYVQLAESFAQQGALAVAVCWFKGGGGPGDRFVKPIACPDAPVMSSADGAVAQGTLGAVVKAVRALHGVQQGRLALWGHSLGAEAVLNYVIAVGGVQAALLDSAGYEDEVIGRAASVRAPVLILHGDADGPADGGSEITNVLRARRFEAALHAAGKSVDAAYYPMSGHNGIFVDKTRWNDEVRKSMSFLNR
jgi:dienelactone hydrolase